MGLSSDEGIGADQSTTDHRASFIIACFLATALYNVLELNFVILSFFKKRQGLYFWSFVVATWGIAPYATGFILKFVDRSRQNVLVVVLISIGWCCMVTGQSFVLYSRLHLVLWNPTRLRFMLCMIIFDAVVCHIPTIVLAAGANLSNSTPFIQVYSVYEKVQVTIFFIQEVTISGLYIKETVKLLRDSVSIHGRDVRPVLVRLVYVNVLVIALDITILALEYSGLYNIQTGYKAFAYSVKLKLEFSILDSLVDLMRSGKASASNQSAGYGIITLNTINYGSTKVDNQASTSEENTLHRSRAEDKDHAMGTESDTR